MASAPDRSSRPSAPASNTSAATRSASGALAARTAIRTKAWLAALLGIALPLSGCYLGHLAVHQTRLLRARQPIDALLADPSVPPETRALLGLAGEARSFAERIGLDVGGQYTSFVEWPGDRVVTTIVVTRPGSVEPAGFWFPITGRVPYKGFFDREMAEREAARLRGDGLDVCETGVPAYSTLGWMDDPVTRPMLGHGEGFLAEVVLHELVHASIYAPGQPDWNEGVASFLGEEASVELFAETGRDAARRRAQVEDDRAIDARLLQLREQVAALYASAAPGPARDAARRRLAEEARAALRALPLRVLDPAEVAAAARLNDACLALRGTYAAHLADFEALLEAQRGDLAGFVLRAREIGAAEDPLAALAP